MKKTTLQLRTLIEGRALSLCEIERDGKSALEKFMKKLPKEKIARLMGHLKTIAENGIPSNTERFVHEEDQIYAIKDFQIRIYCFRYKGSLLVLTHGTVKKQDKANPEDLERAKRLRSEFLEELS